MLSRVSGNISGNVIQVLQCREDARLRQAFIIMEGRRGGWTFLSNHSHVLVAIAKNPDSRIRDLADKVGITERAVAQILADLEAAGVLRKERSGRRNVYHIETDVPLRHQVESHRTVADILRLAEAPVLVARHLKRIK